MKKAYVVAPCTPHRTPSLKKRHHIYYTKHSLTPNFSRLYREFTKSQRQLNFHKRAKRALKFSNTKCFEKLTDKMNPLAARFVWMQIKQCKRKARGRRFSDEEKLIALLIMKQSPKCYKFLHKIFILPSKYTLNKMISQLNIEPGINTQIFNAVKEELLTWDEKKKYCSILFDEVALEAALTYEKHKDIISGFVELNHKTNDFADHALVFMLRGVVEKWQQPLAFYFCKGATSGVELKKIIKEVIVAVGNTGLLPISLVCDQGTAYQSALKSLQDDTRREQLIAGNKVDDVIAIQRHTLSVIYDPPHLIKGLRNNFLTKDIKFKGKISKWSDIVEVYKTDCNHAHTRLLYKLNDEHVIPEKIKKMKVKNCTKVFSKTVSATLSYTAQFCKYNKYIFYIGTYNFLFDLAHYVDGKEVSPTLKNTAEIVSFFDDLFDSVNGTTYNKSSNGKPLKQAGTEKSPHHDFWSKAIKTLQSIRFVDNQGKETTMPSLKNWITTLKSYQRVWQYLGQVRAYNFRNTDPDCHTFKITFRTLLITRFIKFHSEGFNCEEDSGEQLLKLKALFNAKECENVLETACSPEISGCLENDSIQTSAQQERLNVHSRAYTAGWVIRKILSQNTCHVCEENLTSKESSFSKHSVNNWISFKEFKSIKEKKLTTESAVRLYGNISLEANTYLENQPQQIDVVKNIKRQIKSKYKFDFLECEQHRDAVSECFLDFTLRLTVFNWCNVINKILKGTDVIRLENKCLPQMELKAYNKYKTKLRNKKINK